MEQKSRTTAGVLALLLGGIGIHHFYLDNAGRGVLYLLFCWTFIPSIIALVEGIIYLTQSDAEFAAKLNFKNGTMASGGVHYTEELTKLSQLKAEGIITEDEFARRKAQILK